MHKLSDQINKLTEAIDQISLGNRKLTSELVITENVNSRLEKRIINFKKNQAKGKQYSRRNDLELSSIPSSICDEDLENTVINIYKESGIDVNARDIEGCHQLPFSRNSRGHDKIKNDKKRISGKNFEHVIVTNKIFVSVSLCPYYRYIWGKCKDLQRQGKVHHFFCQGGIACINLSEDGSPVKLHHISGIPNFLLDWDIEN